jgi:heavy metal sensor kinase
MRRGFLGTRARLTLVHGAVLAAAILVADLALFVTLSSTDQSATDDMLRAQSSTIAAGIEDINGQIRFGGGDLPAETQQGVAVDAAIVAADGSIIQTAAQRLPVSRLQEVSATVRRQGGSVSLTTNDSNGVSRRLYATRLQGSQGTTSVLIVSRSLAEGQALLGRTMLLLGAFSLLVVTAGSLLAHWLTGRVLVPVRRIAAMARSLSQDDLHRRVDVAVAPDELGDLVETFNGMLARLEESFEALRRFTADASHELRSPLALMRSEVEGARTRPRTVEEYRRVLVEVEEEVDRMGRMVDQMLVLARADAGALRAVPANVDVADLLHETAARWLPAGRPRRVHLEVDAPESGTVTADPDLIRRVIDNLVDNAIRHSPAGGEVRLTAEHRDSAWVVEVRDQGVGVPEPARGFLFQRFARPDAARGRDSGGAGLGLALSRAIAESHGGTLELADAAGAGAVFRLRLPDRTPIAI